jgi:hypothetical protein
MTDQQMNPETLAEAIAELTSDGDTFELPDGRTLRLTFEPDYDTSLEDFEDCYGRVGEPKRSYTGEDQRPESFDGNAEKISYSQGRIWWQPPTDVKRDDPAFSDLRQSVCDALDYGFHAVVVELLDGEDCYGRPIVRGSAALGGIEPLGQPDTDLLSDMIEEAMADADSHKV